MSIETKGAARQNYDPHGTCDECGASSPRVTVCGECEIATRYEQQLSALRSQLAEAERSSREGLLQVLAEKRQVAAALAASEEKARGLGELWVSADEWLAAQENRDHDLWNKTTARLLAAIRSVRALSPSAGPAPETKARLAIERMDGSREVTEWAARCGDQWNGWSCALVAGHKGEHHDGPATWQTGASPAPRVGAESEACRCGQRRCFFWPPSTEPRPPGPPAPLHTLRTGMSCPACKSVCAHGPKAPAPASEEPKR